MKRSSATRFFLALNWVYITLSPALAQINREGVPIITNYTSRSYAASEFNWSIAQDSRGVMYFGNQNELILEYDGIGWHKVRMPGQTWVFSISRGADGTIYAGGSDDFGMLRANETGQLTFQSLRHLIRDSTHTLSRFWKIYSIGTQIYFCTLQTIYIYSPDNQTIETIELPTDSFWSFEADNQLYIGNYNLGLLVLSDTMPVPVRGGEFFKHKDIFAIHRWSSDTLLIGTSNQGLFLLNTSVGKVTSFSFNRWASLTNSKLKNASIYSSTSIGDSLFAFGTQTDGLLVVNRSGQTTLHVNGSLGLQNETVTNLYYPNDGSGVLWLTLANGIASVNIGSPLRMFDGKSGLNGSVYGMAMNRGEFYAATMQGVFRRTSSPNGKTLFTGVKGTQGEMVYSLLNFVSPQGHEVLVAGSMRDIFEIKGDRAIPYNTVTENYWMVQSRMHPNRVYIATSRGIRLMEFGNGRLNFVRDRTFAPSLERETIIRIVEDREGNIWCKAISGLFRVDANGNPLPIPESIKNVSGIFANIHNHIYFIAEGGIYEFDQTSSDFKEHLALNRYFRNKKRMVRDLFPLSDTSALVFFSIDDVLQSSIVTLSGGKIAVDSSALRIVPPMTLNMAISHSRSVYIGGQDGLYVYNLTRPKNFQKPYKALLRSVVIGTDSIVYKGSGGFLNTIEEEGKTLMVLSSPIDFSLNNIVFSFAAPFFENEGEVLYSSFLQGNDRSWSAWQRESSRAYTNLTEGTYRLHVKAINIYGVESDEAIFEFRILPPWYRTWWAYILYVVVAGLTIRIIILLYTRKLQEDNRRLEVTVKERTAEIVEKNHRIEEQNKAITDSIRYAKRIQSAVLPNKQTCSKFDYFIYFSPKDIVSGDFYWVHHLQRDNRLIVIAADCTGHGVPGAFMSMLGTSFLNEIVAKLDVNHSDQILNQLRKYVIDTLSQGLKEQDGTQQKDGMDLAMASIDLNTMILEFSGANNPMVFIRDGEITEYKPDKMPIGAYIKQDVLFSRTEVKLQEGDIFYLFSDGYIDQFGGDDGRKYMKKKFKEFLISIHHEPMEKQKILLIDEMYEWMNGREQIDDQIVIGMRVVNGELGCQG